MEKYTKPVHEQHGQARPPANFMQGYCLPPCPPRLVVGYSDEDFMQGDKGGKHNETGTTSPHHTSHSAHPPADFE